MPKKKKTVKAKTRKKKSPAKKRKPAARAKKTKVRRASGKKSGKKAAVKKPAAPKMEGKLVGEVTHYFPHVEAAVIKVKSGELRVNDSVRIVGHTSDFKQVIASIQIDHRPVDRAKKGAEVGVQVRERVREGDQVYKLN